MATSSGLAGEQKQQPGRANLDDICINTVRTLSMDAVQKANSGHPGTAMAMAPAITTQPAASKVSSAWAPGGAATMRSPCVSTQPTRGLGVAVYRPRSASASARRIMAWSKAEKALTSCAAAS